MAWREFSQRTPELAVGDIVDSASLRTLAAAEIRAYDAPFPDASFKAGARSFPVLVPIAPDDAAAIDNVDAWDRLRHYRNPFLTIFSDSDPVTAGADVLLQRHMPGAADRRHVTVRGGHFLQEDAGAEIADIVAEFVRSS